jgi:membrane protein DedA with SNARE-associated domain
VRPAGVGRTPGSRFWYLRSSALALRIGILGGAIAVFTAAAMVGDLLSPVFIEHHALVLVVLTPRTAYLVALTHEVPLSVFLVVSVARLCAADPLHFMIGRAAGPAVVSAARRTRVLRRLADRLPSRSDSLWLVAVALSPTAKTMVVAGATGLRAPSVAAANVAGTVARVLLIWTAGKAFPTIGHTVAALAPWVAIPSCVAAGALGAVCCRRGLRVARPVV